MLILWVWPLCVQMGHCKLVALAVSPSPHVSPTYDLDKDSWTKSHHAKYVANDSCNCHLVKSILMLRIWSKIGFIIAPDQIMLDLEKKLSYKYAWCGMCLPCGSEVTISAINDHNLSVSTIESKLLEDVLSMHSPLPHQAS